MSTNRRDFLKGLVGGAVAVVVPAPVVEAVPELKFLKLRQPGNSSLALMEYIIAQNAKAFGVFEATNGRPPTKFTYGGGGFS